jgi:23S rRNA pseudouridine1911/1915/1917 synthase
VGNNLKYRRLDKYLTGRFNQFSRTKLQKLIAEQGVNVNGRAAKRSLKLNPGDEIDLILPPKQVRELVAQDIPINIIYEDDDMVALNKQADLIVHPARGYKSGTLVNGLVYHFQQLSNFHDDLLRPGIVHRLDRNTTGVMVVAKNDTAHWKLSRQFQNRTVSKYYLSIVHGVPELSGDRINQPIGTHRRQREKMAIRADGKQAVTFYEVMEEFRGFSLVRLDIRTGRTHQIRVHMQWLGHPVVADDMYDGKAVYPYQLMDESARPEDPVMARPALHAWRMEINHPRSGERMKFEAQLPDDMENLLEQLRKYRS